MKRTLAILALTGASLMAGCHASHRATVLEYRTYRAAIGGSDEGLNSLAAEGWVVQSVTAAPNDSGYWSYLLKRPKK